MGIGRESLPLDAGPTDVLRALRGQRRVVALVGTGWNVGEAVIGCEPIRELATWDEIDLTPITAEGFGGGWIGSWGYQLGAAVERLPPAPPRPVPQPAVRVGFYDVVLRRSEGRWWIEWLDGAAPERIARMREAALAGGRARPFRLGDAVMVGGPDRHRAAIARAVERIGAGDVFQVNVCTRLEADFEGDPLDAFCRGVEELAPAFAAYLADEHGAIASLSPELFLRRSGRDVLTSPIKGTAALDTDPAALAASAKDRAENIMIVDLMRNDLGRVAEPGSVEVPAVTRVERHAVWHLVSDVTASVTVPDSALLRATFPPGSVTGAPKVRAMELIATELESTAREAYTGAIGCISPAAGLELNVAIRTLEFAADRVWLGVGGGIVADSDPQAELTECLVKARPLLEALGSRIADDPPAARAAASTAPGDGTRCPVDVSAGVFTTLLVVDGRPVDLDAHLARLDTSLKELYGRRLSAEAGGRVRECASPLIGRHRLRLAVTPDGAMTLTTSRIDAHEPAWRLVPYHLPGGLGAHKWADRTVLERCADEPLLVDHGDVLETGRASFFAVFDDGLHTPPVDGRILPGTQRARVIATARARGLPVVERPLALAELRGAAEVFVTNAVRGIVPVVEVAGFGTWPAPGPVTAGLMAPPPKDPPACPPVRDCRLLVIDNRDSFVFNLVQYARELGATAEVVRSDAPPPSLDGFTHVLVSPGPGRPGDAGSSAAVVRDAAAARIPLLGVCLGHQVIAEVFGASVVRSPVPVHGKPTLVHHDGRGIYLGLPTPFTAGRYHSLLVRDLPANLVATATTGSGLIMGLRHRSLPVEGVQFHPESVLSQHGHGLLARFLTQPAALPRPVRRGD